MSNKSRSLAINSIMIAVSTAIIATILHELGHYAVAVYYEMNPELHHNYVITFGEGTPDQQAIRAAAGPIVSLLLGIIFIVISVKIVKPSLTKLFLTWFGMQNLLIFFGYLLIAPIAKKGDTGKVFDHLGVPSYVSITISLLSFVVISILYGRFAKEFVYYKNEETFVLSENKRQLFLYPILGSIVIVTLLNLPIVTWISLLPTVFMPMAYFATMGRYRKIGISDAPLIIATVSMPLLIITILSIVLFRFLV